jgi:hypothetical protein
LSRQTTASGSREVAAPRRTVWQALAVLEPYCAVCDVSYVVTGRLGKGTTFVCVPGRLGDRPPTEGAPRGEIVEWQPSRRVTTRLQLTAETWTTRIELADAGDGHTRVTITLTYEPVDGNRLVQRLQRATMQRTVRGMVNDELAKLPAHVAQVTGEGSAPGS